MQRIDIEIAEKVAQVVLSPLRLLWLTACWFDERSARKKGWTERCGSCGEWVHYSILVENENYDGPSGYEPACFCPFCHGNPDRCMGTN